MQTTSCITGGRKRLGIPPDRLCAGGGHRSPLSASCAFQEWAHLAQGLSTLQTFPECVGRLPALEWAPDIRAKAMQSGPQDWPQAAASEAQINLMLKQVPVGRVGQWSGAVQAAAHLVPLTNLNSLCLTVDGGRSSVS